MSGSVRLTVYVCVAVCVDRTYLSRLVAHIIANVQIELSDVQVRYDCTSTSLAEVRFLSLFYDCVLLACAGSHLLTNPSLVTIMQRPGSATLEVGFVSLINTNSKWELEFTPQSNGGMESRKLLKIEGVSAYIEYEVMRQEARDSVGEAEETLSQAYRKYLFHDWYSIVKVSGCFCLMRLAVFEILTFVSAVTFVGEFVLPQLECVLP